MHRLKYEKSKYNKIKSEWPDPEEKKEFERESESDDVEEDVEEKAEENQEKEIIDKDEELGRAVVPIQLLLILVVVVALLIFFFDFVVE